MNDEARGHENDNDYREEKCKEVKTLLYHHLYSFSKLRSYKIEYDHYLCKPYYYQFLPDHEGYQDTHVQDRHYLFAVFCNEDKNKKAILFEYTSCYDYSVHPVDEYISFEEHPATPTFTCYSLEKFLSCTNQPICSQCKKFDISLVSYIKIFKSKNKSYLTDMQCHDHKCQYNIQLVANNNTKMYRDRIPFHDVFTKHYKDFVLYKKYKAYFQTDVLSDLIAYSLSPSRLQWILDDDTKKLWNL